MCCNDTLLFRTATKQKYLLFRSVGNTGAITVWYINFTVFTRSPLHGKRGNVIVMDGCVCMCVCVSRSEPDALWPNPSSHSFRFRLIWKVNSSSFRRCKKCCRVTWPWPIYLASKWPPDENRVFSLCLVDLWENGRRYRNDFNGQLLGKWVWAFQRHQSQPSNLTPSPIWGVENM